MIKKRGQATVFVIVGILILAVVVVLFTLRGTILERLGLDALTDPAISEQLKRVQTFTEECIGDRLDQAILLAGQQGGFIILPDDEFPQAPYNVLSNNIDVFGNGISRVPYWFYKTPNNLERTQVPTKQELEENLASYVDAQLQFCLNDYSLFLAQGYNILASDPVSTVELDDNQVNIETAMEVSVENKGEQASFKTFKTSVEAPLGRLYKQAIELFYYEQEKGFIENATLDFMAIYDQIPFSGVDFQCSPRAWVKTQVAEDFKKILALNIPTLKVAGTDYKLRKEADKVLIHKALKNPREETVVNFRFSEEWPILMDVVGEDAEVLRGKPFTLENEASQFLLPLFCLNDYHFVYDIKYPILISLQEGDTVFQFGVMAIIDNNQPKENRVELLSFDESSPICENKPSRIKVTASGLAADGTPVPLEGVDIALKCLTAQCDIGKTEQSVGVNQLEAQFPACVNGQLVATKEGYHRSKTTVDTVEDASYTVFLEPYYELPVTVRIEDEGTLREPYPTEQILFQFENQDQEYYTSYYYPSNNKLRLLAGDYIITATTFVKTQGGFTLEEETIEICVDVPKKGVGGFFGLTEKECTSQTIEGTTLETVQSGLGSTSWYVDRRALATADGIALYGLRGTTPRTFTELGEIDEGKVIRRPNLE